MEKEKALAIWDAIYGKNASKWQTDCFDIWIYRDDYGDTETHRKRPNGDGKEHSYGWEIDHIRPKSSFAEESEANLKNNYEPMHWQNNRDKADNYPGFTIGSKKYNVVKCDICSSNGLKGYGITDSTGKRIDWKAKQKQCFAKNKN